MKQIQEKLEEKRKNLAAEEEEARKCSGVQVGNDISNRRPSRFAVTTQSGTTFVPDSDAAPQAEGESVTAKVLEQLKSKPPKSILKKNNRYTIHGGHQPPQRPRPRLTASLSS